LGNRAGRITHTEELFYVIGALLGDGCTYFWKNRYYIWLYGEREFAAKFAERVSVCTNKQKAKAYFCRGRNVWFVTFQNAELYFLIRRIRDDIDVASDMLRRGDRSANGLQLIEGFFDAEGCVKVIREEVRRTPKICLDFSNTDVNLIELFRRALKDTLNIEGRLVSQTDSRGNRLVNHHLRMYGKDAIRKFLLHVHTVKLKAEKVQYVEKWLQQKKGKERGRNHFRALSNLAPTSSQFVTFHHSSTYFALSFL
jgi:intein-encoded DNA endonuclease-like protein